jgi:hypothetical protein
MTLVVGLDVPCTLIYYLSLELGCKYAIQFLGLWYIHMGAT